MKGIHFLFSCLCRKGENLPESVTVEGGMLRFSRPLRLTDKGAYICTTTNLVGSGKAEIELNISGKCLSHIFSCHLVLSADI